MGLILDTKIGRKESLRLEFFTGIVQDLKNNAEGEIPIEKFCQTTGKSKLNREEDSEVENSSKREKASNPQGKEKKKGFSSGMIPKGIRLLLAPKKYQIQASGMS